MGNGWSILGYEVPTTWDEATAAASRGLDSASRGLEQAHEMYDSAVSSFTEAQREVDNRIAGAKRGIETALLGPAPNTASNEPVVLNEPIAEDSSNASADQAQNEQSGPSAFNSTSRIFLRSFLNLELPNPYDFLEILFPNDLDSRRRLAEVTARLLGLDSASLHSMSLDEILDAIETKYQSIDLSPLAYSQEANLHFSMGVFLGIQRGHKENLTDEEFQKFLRALMDPANAADVYFGFQYGLIAGFIWGIINDILFLIATIMVLLAASFSLGPILIVCMMTLIGCYLLFLLSIIIVVGAAGARAAGYAFDPEQYRHDREVLEDLVDRCFSYLLHHAPEYVLEYVRLAIKLFYTAYNAMMDLAMHPEKYYEAGEAVGYYIGKHVAQYSVPAANQPNYFYNTAYNWGYAFGEISWFLVSLFVPGVSELKVLKLVYKGGRGAVGITARVGTRITSSLLEELSQGGMGRLFRHQANSATLKLVDLTSHAPVPTSRYIPKIEFTDPSTLPLIGQMHLAPQSPVDDIATVRGTASRGLESSSEPLMPVRGVASVKVPGSPSPGPKFEMKNPNELPSLGPVTSTSIPHKYDDIVDDLMEVEASVTDFDSTLVNIAGGNLAARRGFIEPDPLVPNTGLLGGIHAPTSTTERMIHPTSGNELWRDRAYDGTFQWRRVDLKKLRRREAMGLGNTERLTRAIRAQITESWLAEGHAAVVKNGKIIRATPEVMNNPQAIALAKRIGDGNIYLEMYGDFWFPAKDLHFGHILSAVEFYQLTMNDLVKKVANPARIADEFELASEAFMTSIMNYMPSHRIINEGMGRRLGQTVRYRFQPGFSFTPEEFIAQIVTVQNGKRKVPLPTDPQALSALQEDIARAIQTLP